MFQSRYVLYTLRASGYGVNELIPLSGDVVYLNVVGQPMIVLNTQKAAGDILDRRAAVNSGRPRLIVGHELICGGLFFAMEPHNER